MSMLSLNTNPSSLFTQKNMMDTQRALAVSMTRLGTGYRVNSAMDDAAGLQIATRMKADSVGMNAAMKNAQNGISLLQTAEGSLQEITNILLRMKELASEGASTGSTSAADRAAMQAEYDQLGQELGSIIRGTRYGGDLLLAEDGGSSSGSSTKGRLASALTFQIGASAEEIMKVDVSAQLKKLNDNMAKVSSNYKNKALSTGKEIGESATIISDINSAVEALSALRSTLGASAKRLDHVVNNQLNIDNHTTVARGRIMDTDYAKESVLMNKNQMLMQAGTSMLKQSGLVNQLVLTLMQ